MMKAGVPLLQSFDIVGKGHANPSMSKLIMDIRADIETGTSLNNAFRKYPLLLRPAVLQPGGRRRTGRHPGRPADRLAIYKEKTLAMKSKIKSALTYPISILAVAFIVTAVIMIWVVPAFKEVFTSFGADLPAPTLIVMAMSEFFVPVVVPDLRLAVRRDLLLLPGLAPLAEDAAGDGPPAAARPIFGP
jgi:type IV pilus assembly protein PilC